MPDLGETCALDISHKDPVNTLGQGSQTDLREAGLKKLQIIAGAHHLRPRQIIYLIEQIDDCAVDLAVLQFAHHISRLSEFICKPFHAGLGTASCKEIMQFLGPDSSRPGPPGLIG